MVGEDNIEEEVEDLTSYFPTQKKYTVALREIKVTEISLGPTTVAVIK